MADILIVEPDNQLAAIYSRALSHQGHQLRLVHSAQKAINSCDKDKPDLVILELQLGEHNGVEFLYELRSYPEWSKIPVIVLSSVPKVDFDTSQVLWDDLVVAKYYYKPHTNLKQLISGVSETLAVPA